MIKLQVLRYMGILTIMKLSVFALSALSLLFALTWVLIYCPIGNSPAHLPQGNIYNTKNRMEMADYFDHYEEELERDLENFEQERSELSMEKKEKKKSDVTIPRKLFSDAAFEEMVKQVNTRELDGYEFLAESMNVTIYRTPKGDAGLYKYKLYATLPDAPPEKIAGVFLDNEYRVVWDQYVTKLYVVEAHDKGPDVIYFNVDFPWPLANRDYVYAREVREETRDGVDYVVIVMHSVLRHNIPEVKGAIRVSDYHQSLALTKFKEHGTRAYIEYYDNPKGSIPSWLVNWAAKTGVPAFMKDLQRACSGFEEFQRKHKKSVN